MAVLKRKKGVLPVWMLLASVVVGFLAFRYTQADAEVGVLQRRAADAEIRLRELREQNEALRARVEDLRSDAAVERAARENLGLIKPGEIPYRIVPAER